MSELIKVTSAEARVIDEMRKLMRTTDEWRLEIVGRIAHGRPLYSIRPTPYYKVEFKDRIAASS